jgi:hypothetical protein
VGGKTSTSTSQVQIPPEVLARYASVNQTAETAAQQPFQQYSTNPNAFVAPLTPTQYAGVGNTNAAAGMAQPYFQAGTGFALAGAQPVSAAPLDISKYMNPYLQTVLGSTEANVNQQNQQAMAGQLGNAINQGYFGGDRSGIAAAVLAAQQQLTGGQLYSGIASDAFNQALAAATQQQGVGLGAAQANRAALQQTGETLAGLGTGAQGAALSGAQAQLGAGQVEQQTQQAGLTALYNQFLQQQSYPFQVAQFLGNIAEGTGALSGSTTTSTQPGGLFMSDERLKEDMRPIGKGFDGANIYRFRYRGDPDNVTRIGFSAQETEHRHPEAVHDVGGFKAVDQGAASDDAAAMGGFGRAANDDYDEPRVARQAGGGMSEWGSYPMGVNPMVIAQLLAAQAQMYGPSFGGAGLYGSSASATPHGGAGYVPQPSLPVGALQIARAPSPPPASALHEAASTAGDISTLADDAGKAYDWGHGEYLSHRRLPDDPAEDAAAQEYSDVGPDVSAQVDALPRARTSASGGFRAARQDGGDINPYGATGGLNIPTGYGGTPRQLQTPGAPGQGPGALHQAGQMAGDVNSLVKTGQTIGKGIDWLSNLASGVPFAQGGFARARRDAGGIIDRLPQPWQAEAGGLSNLYNKLYGLKLADGGSVDDSDPYKPPGPGLDIPDQLQQHPQLQVAKPPSQQGNQTMSDIMDVAKIAAMFAARGGRIHRQDGGDANDNELPTTTAAVTDPEGAYQAQRAGTQGVIRPDLTHMGPRNAIIAGTLAGGDPTYAAFGADMPDDSVTNPHTGGASIPVHIPPPHRAPPIMSPAQRAAVAHPQTGQTGDPVIPGGYNIQDLKFGAAPVGAAPAPRSWAALGQPQGPAAAAPSPAPAQPSAHRPVARRRAPRLGGTWKPAPAAPATPPPGAGGAAAPPAALPAPDVTTAPLDIPPVRGLSDVDAAAGLGQGPNDITQAAPQGPLTPHPVQHVGGQPPPVVDSANNPIAAGGVQHEAGPGFIPAAQGGQGGGGFGGLLGGIEHLFGDVGKAGLGLMGYEGNGQWNRDQLIPFISALAGTLGAPTKYPLVALSQGLQSGAQSYMQQQQREAQLSQTDIQNLEYAQNLLPPNMRNAFRAVPGPGRPGQKTIIVGNQQYHYEPSYDLFDTDGGGAAPPPGGTTTPTTAPPTGAPASSAAPSAAVSIHRDAITPDYENGAYNIGPGSVADEFRASEGLDAPPAGLKGSGLQAWGGAHLITDDQIQRNAYERGVAEALPTLDQTRNTQRQYMAIGDSLDKLAATGISAPGAGFDARKQAANAIETARNIVNGMLPQNMQIPANASVQDIVNAGQEIDKIRGMTGPMMAQTAGQHSAHVSDLLTSILPGAQYQPEAARRVLGMMVLQNRQDADHQQYAQTWLAKYGNYLGMNEAFDREFGPRYRTEAAEIPAMMAKGKNGRSAVTALRNNPTPGAMRAFDNIYGNGASRIWLGA